MASDEPVTRARPPFAHLRPVALVAGVYAAAALVWAVVGDPLPGGRWAAVHLFTLGTLTHLIVAMTDHFARTVTKAPGDDRRQARLAVLSVGVLAVLVGRIQGWPELVAVGAVLAVAAVMWLYLGLRRMRTRALGARFAFVVRAYERACGMFAHGAVLGAVLGLGWAAGDWYAGVRHAHLAVNVLGWGGLVLLATVVFFAPTLMRTRITAGADRRAAPALRIAAWAVTVTAVALILTGAPGVGGQVARGVAVVGLGAYAGAVTAVCVPVLQAARRSVALPHARMIAAVCVWFPVVAWAATVVVAGDLTGALDALGAVVLVGVLGQAVLAAIGYLLPMITGAGAPAREVQRRRLDRLGAPRVAALNAGVALIAAGALAGGIGGAAGWGPALTGGGWLLVVAAVAASAALALAALPAGSRASA